MTDQTSGVLILDKPSGLSSNQALSQVKRCFGLKKAGFIGTLDPLATGVLPVFLGKSTKLIPYFENRWKAYWARMELGKTSDSLDLGTEVATVPLPQLEDEQIRQAVLSFVGEISQVPPAYSAIRVNGQRSYKLARQNTAVELPERKVFIKKYEEIRISQPFVEFIVHVYKGTYIRKLAEDIAVKLGTKAVLSGLRRVRHGSEFPIESSVSLERIKNIPTNQLSSLFLRPENFIMNSFATVKLEEEHMRLIRCGMPAELPSEALSPAHSAGAEDQELYRDQCFALDALNTVVAAGCLEFSRDQLTFRPKKMLI